MSHRPWLSIIVPALNEAAVITDTLGPLQSWRGEGVEILLVDGGSDDATCELARPLVDSVLVSSRGRAAQMNAGAEAAHADLLWFLHADTRVLAGARQALDSFPQGLAWGRFDVGLSGHHYLFPVIASMMNWRSAFTGMVTGDQGMVIRRQLFDRVGGFPVQALMEDLAISRRLKQQAWPVRLGRYLVADSRRWEAHGVWRTVWLMWVLRLRYFFGADPAHLARRYS